MKKRNLKVVVLGTQAAGKGTQSYILSVTAGVPGVSMGNILRDLSKEDSERGRVIKEHVGAGTFPPDPVVVPVLKDWLDKHPGGWIIDGFPRNVAQAELSAPFLKPDAVVYIDLPDEDSKRRISYRRICSKCKTNYNLITQPPKNSRGVCDVCGGELVQRPDDTPALIEERLRLYHEQTEPLKDWFAKRKNLVVIDGTPGITEVAHEIELRLNQLLVRKALKRRLVWWAVAAVLLLLVVSALFVVIGATTG